MDYQIEISKNSKDALISFSIPKELVTNEVRDFISNVVTMCQTYAKKNHDYGNSFEKGMDTIGDAYGVGRMFDKMNRIINLTKPGITAEINEESVKDTLIDLASYAVMYVSYMDKKLYNKL